MKRKSFEGDVCSIARALDVIGDWWSLLIIRDALSGVRRFSDFQRRLGVAKNILSTRLRTLVAHELLEQVPAEDGSAYQDYQPTAKAQGLLPVLLALGQWGSEHLFEQNETCAMMIDTLNEQPLAKLSLRAQDGRELSPKEIKIQRRTKQSA